MSSLLTRDAVEDTYGGCRRVLHRTVYGFWKRYGGDLDEIRSEAYELYTVAYTTYDHRRGTTFHTHLTYQVEMGLRESMRNRIGRCNRLPRVRMDLTSRPCHQPDFDLFHFLGGLSEDARYAATLVFDTPPEVEHALGMRKRGLPKPTKFRTALREYLTDSGWDNARVTKAFKEIKGAL